MQKFLFLLLGFSILFAPSDQGWAAGHEAAKLRSANSLFEFTPPESFLNGNYVADEVEPAFIFGKVRDFVKTRSCPTAWLIDEGEKKRLQGRNQQSGSFEYALYLEEDCSGKVSYYVFVDRSQANAIQWLEWRKQFHKSKAEPQYAAARAGMERAAQDGFQVDAELRFIEVGGALQLKKTEDILIDELKIKPIYDLRQARSIAK